MYTFTSRIRYTEINHQRGSMDPSSIINYFQDCSTFQSEDLNIGLSYLHDKNRIWLLTSWHLVINKPVGLGEYVTVGTWPYAFKGFFGYRNFILKNKREEILAVADSIWVYMDTHAGRPVRVPEDNAGYILEPAYPMEHAKRKILIPDELLEHPPFPVVKSNIDSYNHVNNGQYIKMAEEFLPNDFTVSEMRVEYRQQAVLGDIIFPRAATCGDIITVVLSDSDCKPYTIIEFKRN